MVGGLEWGSGRDWVGGGKKGGHFISWRGRPGFSLLPCLGPGSVPPLGKTDLESGDQGSSPRFAIGLWLTLGLLCYLLWASVS